MARRLKGQSFGNEGPGMSSNLIFRPHCFASLPPPALGLGYIDLITHVPICFLSASPPNPAAFHGLSRGAGPPHGNQGRGQPPRGLTAPAQVTEGD